MNGTGRVLLLCAAVGVACLFGCGGKKVGASKTGGTHGAVLTKTVLSAREFRAALGSNTVIELMPGVYNISEWDPNDEDSEGGAPLNLPKGVSWTEENGEGLTLTGISNLTIRGVTGSGEWPKIIVDPRNVYVLRFVNCSDIVIESLTAGHSEGGYCGGGVFEFKESSRITVNATAMYGSGTEGLTLRNVSEMKVTNSKIYECTEAIFSVDGGGKVAFENCLFIRNRGYHLVYVAGDGAQHLSITDCEFRDNWNEDGSGGMFFLTGEGISISRTKFIGNKINKINVGNNNVPFGEGCEFDDVFIDARDGMGYRFVKIGNQTWMADNMNYQTPNSYCYNNSDYACVQYGRLYKWDAAKEACPAGWHLPSKEEWNALVAVTGGGEAGNALKSTSGWDENGNGTNGSGFSALPGGLRNAGGGFERVNGSGNWWTASERDGNFAYYRFMGNAKNTVFENYYSKDGGYSVRCVQDAGANAESPSDEQTLIERIPPGYRIHSIDGEKQIFRGDLNGDGADDYAIIIEEEETDDYPERGVMIFFKDGGGYRLALENINGLGSKGSEDCGACGYRQISFEIAKGNFYIYYQWGKGDQPKETFTFRYRNSEFELIGYDVDVNNIKGATSINFPAKKKLVKECPKGKKCKETWTAFTMEEPILLRKIADFPRLEFADYMKEATEAGTSQNDDR
jgi:uncharacterized protein (TIGR02145 family)